MIGLVGIAHMISHFSQLLLAPLFPWLKDEFSASYAELGFLMTLFFVVSCAVQAAAGFVVDRFGPRPVLFAGLALWLAIALVNAENQRHALATHQCVDQVFKTEVDVACMQVVKSRPHWWEHLWYGMTHVRPAPK